LPFTAGAPQRADWNTIDQAMQNAVGLHQAGRLAEAEAIYCRILAEQPGLVRAWNRLGTVWHTMGRIDQAIDAYDRAITLRPDYAPAHCNLGRAMQESDRLDEAIAAYERALALKPDLVEAWNNLGSILAICGCVDESLACYRRAVALQPGFASAASNLLYTLHFHPGYDAPAILAEHRHWAARFAEPLARRLPPHTNDRTPDRRLKIGYVSPDFNTHVQALFVPHLLGAHDRENVEVYCYSSVRQPDAITARCRSAADVWRDVVHISDEALAQQIRDDRIDILVDLTMHMANNRVAVFACKPAPVQVAYLAYPGTTGLATMDYRLTDAFLDPPGETDAHYTERSVRLRSFWCYDPPQETPPVGPLPAERNGYVTFGCYNNFAKASQPALELWARVLQALPGSRLVLLAPATRCRDSVHRLFQRAGITGDRIAFVARADLSTYFQRYHDIDVGLDPIPYNGHTSTLDSLWMGVPVVTLAGRTAVGRGGVSILSNVGLPELIARTPEEYVAIAAGLASDRPRLSALRAGLRARIEVSPLRDRRQFAADIESAFRAMWQHRCARSGPEPTAG
jgi:predicted O-linked N-acetylglucosamine transferase (SPINDLY family)